MIMMLLYRDKLIISRFIFFYVGSFDSFSEILMHTLQKSQNNENK